MFLFVTLAFSNKPIILVPPLYGSNLWVTYDQMDANWYCPDKMSDTVIWVNPKLVVPPMYNCLFQMLQLYWDNDNNKIISKPGLNISVHDFGGEESVRYVVSDFYGINLIETFASIIDFFKDNGYTIKKDILAAPYDWRMAPAGLDDFWPKLINLIETTYENNDHQKITMFGFSCGGHSLQQFLSEHVKPDWIHRYIDRAILLAPSFGAATESFHALWEGKFPIVPVLNSQELADMVESMAVVHCHLPNHVIFGDDEVVRSPYDQKYTASQVRDLLVNNSKITGDNIKILDKCQELSRKAPGSLHLPTYIIYNSAVQTNFIVNFKNGWDKPAKQIPVPGDGTIIAKGTQWACQNWPVDEYPLYCEDLYRDNEDFVHQPLAANPYVHDLIYKLHTNDDWINTKGRYRITSQYIVVNKNMTYEARTDIRERHVTFSMN
ncbi:Lecithin:cholesterol acyltransferase family protein [Histomonas meleagridis]|uniref:Lecithin:cholesterol acyltransferase family protein n=1 Tax=Histomonas meleagridis TaxID=135588 RepID=UPI00355A2E63|nr:Lecithin:cholesterol acyltransferase family protein [Histomonas meleagridis]KAH0800455.1 Lecithin:cholesterol acyltransferase family protein [Histomonas meleagridis]